jgi:hypothetical protein
VVGIALPFKEDAIRGCSRTWKTITLFHNEYLVQVGGGVMRLLVCGFRPEN